MSDEDPIRLKDAGDVSPALLRALQALRDHPSEAARLSRVAEKLGVTLADVPTAGPGPEAVGFRLIGIKSLVVGILVVGVAAVAWMGYQRGRPSANEPQPRREVSSAEPASAVEASKRSGPRLDPQATSPAPQTARIGVPGGRDARRSAHPRDAKPALRPSDPPTPAGSTTSVTSVTSVTGVTSATTEANAASSAPQPTAASAEAETTAARTDDPPREPAEATSEPASARPAVVATPAASRPSEAALLFEARKAVRAQPSAALQLLEQHAQRFPDGVLAPEREVLWIEALRKLGRTSEAEQRERAFESRYPDSIHLRRLKSSPR